MTRSSQADFDFLRGSWRVAHRKLARRLVGSEDWRDFGGTMTLRPVLGGQGNIDDNFLDDPTGPYRAASVRAFDPRSRQWAIWWLDSRFPDSLGTPVLGSFENGVGTFCSDDVDDGRPVRTRFLWTGMETGAPRWEQAMSVDGGASWEVNWIMSFSRVGD